MLVDGEIGMRTFEEISDDLKATINLVIEKETKLKDANKEADEMIAKAEAMKLTANKELNEAKNKANVLMSEHQSLMTSIFGDPTGRVRQSK